MQPRQIRDTFMPVDPNRTYSIYSSYQIISGSGSLQEKALDQQIHPLKLATD